MFDTSSAAMLVYGVTLGITIIFGLFLWFAVNFFRRQSGDASYDSQLQELIEDDDITGIRTDKGRNLGEKWRIYWQTIAHTSGFPAYSSLNNNAHKHIIYMAFGLMVVVTVLLKNPILGIIVPGLAVFAVSFVFKQKNNKKSEVIQDQLPGFLFALKANVQANETPQKAILKIVDNMPEPLRSELMVVKQKILSNSTFEESLTALFDNTDSNELKFLAACLIQAASTGANIEPQIDTIQKVLEQRKAAADELAKAVKSTKPAIWIASLAIPFSFMFSYFVDVNAKNFWLKDPLSFVVLFVVGVLWAVGLLLVRRMVENIRNL